MYCLLVEDFYIVMDNNNNNKSIFDILKAIFLTNRPALIQWSLPISGISDHEGVCVISALDAIVYQQCKQKKLLGNIASYRTNFLLMYDIVNKINSTGFVKDNCSYRYPIDSLWVKFKAICAKCIKLVPTKLVFSRFSQSRVTMSNKRLSCKKQ